jgi:hypothetical protein
MLPVIAITVESFKSGTNTFISGYFFRYANDYVLCIIPKSPCIASEACKNKEGVPVELK